MFRPLAVNIGLRYANSRKSFVSFISLVAILGLVLSVAVLLLVTSVMNGFERELRDRILGVVPHVSVHARQPLGDLATVQATIESLPGVVAGCLMTFILSLGYYITPALVGGPRDQMVSNFISVYINRDLNWGLAASLGMVLLVVTLAIYLLFLRLVGADKIKLG